MEIPPSTPEHIGIGATVFVQFEKPYYDQKKYYSNAPDRKTIVPVLEVHEDVVPGVEYEAIITHETSPLGREGVYKCQIKRVSEFGNEQIEKMRDGYEYVATFNKDDTEKDWLEEYTDTQWGIFDVLIEDFGRGDSGNLDHKRYGVWIKARDPDSPPRERPRVEVVKQSLIGEIRPGVFMGIEPMGENEVRIFDRVVERVDSESPHVPHPSEFTHIAWDQRTSVYMRREASAFQRRSPLLLVGDTDTSKTTLHRLFAGTIGLPSLRLNLHNETDTGNFIGRFVPNDGRQRRQFLQLISGWSSKDDAEREAALKRVGSESARILSTAKEAGVGKLTKTEAMKIAAANGLNISKQDWIFEWGMLPQAMVRGYQMHLDEVFNAEPAVNEAGNPAFELTPSLVLEDGTRIGPGGDYEVHKNFWLVGSTNAAGMVGRSVQSEAFLRRWRDYYLMNPTEKNEYLEMGLFLIHGNHPVVQFESVKYQMPSVTPYFAELQDQNEIGWVLKQLVEFHWDMRQRTHPPVGGTPTLGIDRDAGGAKYSNTRATIMSVLDYMGRDRILDVPKTAKLGRKVWNVQLDRKVREAIDLFYVECALESDRGDIRDSWNMRMTNSAWKI
jgi:MoxR-like ATPase